VLPNQSRWNAEVKMIKAFGAFYIRLHFKRSELKQNLKFILKGFQKEY